MLFFSLSYLIFWETLATTSLPLPRYPNHASSSSEPRHHPRTWGIRISSSRTSHSPTPSFRRQRGGSAARGGVAKVEELHGGGGFGARVDWGQSMELLKEERNRRSWLCHSSWLLRSSSSSSSSSSFAVTYCNTTTKYIP